jgi:virginiamycin B lyase
MSAYNDFMRRKSIVCILVTLFLMACEGQQAAQPTLTPAATAVPVTSEAELTPEVTLTLAATTIEPTATQPIVESATEPTTAPTETATEAAPAATATSPPLAEPTLQEYPVPAGSRPHDVAPAPDGSVWYTAQRLGEMGRLDPATGETHHIPLGSGSAPHGVIVGPDDAAWVTDGGLNAIVRVDAVTEAVDVFPLPPDRPNANLNTAAFDGRGMLWFTGQNGIYGSLDPATGAMTVYDAPRGRGPYGITATPDGDIYYASLAGSYVGQVDVDSGEVTVLEPPTPGQGARRVWSDSQGHIWVSEWNGGQVAMYDPADGSWQEWPLPGDAPTPYAVYVDEQDQVWLSDFGGNALVRFDPASETFAVFPLPSPGANVRQILGRPGEVWGAESGVDKLIVIRTR